MAIDFGSLQMRLNPLSPINVGNGGQEGYGLEHLQLARAQFEEQKRNNELNRKLQAQANAAQAAQAQLKREDEQKATAAAAAQKLRDERLAAYQKFTELNGGGDIEGARAMVPMMSALGMNVDLLGEEHGLPAYQIDMDAAEAQKAESAQLAQTTTFGEGETAEQSLDRLGGMGYPTDETGNLDDPSSQLAPDPSGPLTIDPAAGDLDAGTQDALTPGPDDMAPLGDEDTVDVRAGGLQPAILPGQDAYLRALGARQHFEATGEPVRPPDEADFTGAVRKNVIDTGATHDQTLARLNPALQGFVGAYPEEYRDSATQTADAVRGLGLPAAKSLEMADKLRSSPDSLIKSQLESEAKKGEREGISRMEREALYKNGYGYGEEAGTTYGIRDVIERRKTTAQALAVLTNKEDADDYMAGASVSRLMGEKGATTEGDISRVLGTAAQSFLDRIGSRLYKEAIGGLSPSQKNALIGVLKKSQETDVARAHDFLSNIDERLSSPDTDPEVARGLRGYRNAIIPRDIRDGYEGKRKKPEGDAAPQASAGSRDEAADEVMVQAADAGLDPDAVLALMSGESGGNTNAANSRSSAKGLFQFTDQAARGAGLKDAAEYASLPAAEQVAHGIAYFKKKGITEDSPPEDYALAIAAPAFIGKPPETVVYKKGSREHTDNRPWWPADGGDITVADIAAYYQSHGLGKQASTGVTSVGAAANAADKRALDLLAKVKGR